MRKLIIYLFLILFSCCKKNSEIVENNMGKIENTEHILENTIDFKESETIIQNNKESGINNLMQKNIPQEKIIFHSKLETLNKINENITEKNYKYVKEIINNIDINKYLSGLYSILNNDTIKTKDKISLIKYLSNGNISNPYILVYLPPNEYDIFINEFSLDINAVIDELGRTILHEAVRINNTELFDYLLTKNININSIDNNSLNALFYAFEFHPIDWFDPIYENEEDAGINLGNDTYSYGIPYYSKKIINKEDRRLYIINKLLENGININQKTKYGWTILHFSIFVTMEYVYNLFLSFNANELILTKYGRTPKDLLKYNK
jgi:ankyrin repeat protein